MNQTLEQIAATLFKKYFVDGVDPDNLPEGWRVARIEDIAEVIDCLHSKKPDRVNYDTEKILLQLDNILDSGLLDLSNKFYITNEDYKKWISRIEVEFGDCVITNVTPLLVFRIALCGCRTNNKHRRPSIHKKHFLALVVGEPSHKSTRTPTTVEKNH